MQALNSVGKKSLLRSEIQIPGVKQKALSRSAPRTYQVAEIHRDPISHSPMVPEGACTGIGEAVIIVKGPRRGKCYARNGNWQR